MTIRAYQIAADPTVIAVLENALLLYRAQGGQLAHVGEEEGWENKHDGCLNQADEEALQVLLARKAACTAQKRRQLDENIALDKGFGFFDEVEAGVCYVNKRSGATTGAWPGAQAFCGWKGSGGSGKGGCGPWYVQQFMREQSRTVVEG